MNSLVLPHKYCKRPHLRAKNMELLNWFKKPIKWWVGLVLIILGTVLMRQVYVWPWAQPVGGCAVFVGIVMVLLFGRVKADKHDVD